MAERKDDQLTLLDRASGLISAADAAATGFVEDARDLVHAGADEVRQLVDETVTGVRDALPTLDEVLAQAALLPGVSVDREEFLRQALGRRHARVVEQAVRHTPAHAGLSTKELSKLAGKALGKEARRTTVMSMAAGVAGGAAAAASIPADLVQFYGHLLRAIQMLSYLYGWRDTCYVPTGRMDEDTRRALILFLGVMAGIAQADAELARVAPLRETGGVARALAAGEACGAIADALAARMTQRLGGQVAGKAVPIVGAIISGTISYGGFSDMWKRLRKQLAPLA